jgi:hypothetical protein
VRWVDDHREQLVRLEKALKLGGEVLECQVDRIGRASEGDPRVARTVEHDDEALRGGGRRHRARVGGEAPARGPSLAQRREPERGDPRLSRRRDDLGLEGRELAGREALGRPGHSGVGREGHREALGGGQRLRRAPPVEDRSLALGRNVVERACRGLGHVRHARGVARDDRGPRCLIGLVQTASGVRQPRDRGVREGETRRVRRAAGDEADPIVGRVRRVGPDCDPLEPVDAADEI